MTSITIRKIAARNVKPLAAASSLAMLSSLASLWLATKVEALTRSVEEFRDSESIPLIVGMLVGIGLANSFRFYLLERASDSTIRWIHHILIDAISTLPPYPKNRFKPGDLVSRLTVDSNYLKYIAGSGISELIGSGFITIIGVVLLSVMNLKLTAVCLVTFGVFTLFYSRLGRKIGSLSRDAQKSYGELSDKTASLLQVFNRIKADARESTFRHILSKTSDDVLDANMSINRRVALLQPIGGLVSVSALALVSLVGLAEVESGRMDGAELASYVVVLVLVSGGVLSLAEAIPSIFVSLGALDRISAILAADKEDMQKGDIVDRIDTLAFQNASMSLGGALIFENLNAVFSRGSLNVIVGKSGRGKSSLLNCIVGFEDLTGGNVLYNGRNCKEFNLGSLRERISYLQQDHLLYPGSLTENSEMCGVHMSIEELLNEIRLSGLADGVISTLDDVDSLGYLQSSQSGGERSRIALVLAMLRDSDVILLDEPTASLDFESRRRVVELIRRLKGERIVFVVDHTGEFNSIADSILSFTGEANVEVLNVDGAGD